MLEIIIELNLQGRRAVTSHWSAESMRTLRSSAWTPFTPPSSSPPYSTSTSALPSSGLLLQNSWRVTNRVARIDSPLRFPRICSQFQKFHSKFDARIAEHSTIRKCVRDLNFIFYSSFTFTRIVDNSINLLINYLYYIDDMLISFSKSIFAFRILDRSIISLNIQKILRITIESLLRFASYLLKFIRSRRWTPLEIRILLSRNYYYNSTRIVTGRWSIHSLITRQSWTCLKMSCSRKRLG